MNRSHGERRSGIRWGCLVLALCMFGGTGQAQSSQTPAEFFGFTLGDDPRLPDWDQVVAYFEHLSETSDHVRFETVGRTSQDRPLILATVSSGANLDRSEEIRQIQMKLADPRRVAPSELDTIILPAYRSPGQLLEGHAPGSYPPEMTGGISAAGVEQLKRFVAAGGTLLTLGQSTDFAIEQLGLPVERVSGLTVSMFGRPVDATDGTPDEEFVVPGSFLRINANREHPIGYGMPEEFSGLFNRGQVLYPSGTEATGVALFPSGPLLLSGMALGEELLSGKSAVVDVVQGDGHVVLFAIRPEIRLQTRGSYKLLFNALYRSASERK